MSRHDDPRQLSFGVWPARNTDPVTSHLAAGAIQDRVPELERKVLDLLRAVLPGGLTISEATERLAMDKVCISPRFRPLARKDLIYESGFRIEPATGRRQIVWKAVAFPCPLDDEDIPF